MLRQETNAYAILPSSQWRGFTDVDMSAPPHPSTWGACPPLPSLIEQACASHQEGGNLGSIVRHLADDPRDSLAAALAGLGRALRVR